MKIQILLVLPIAIGATARAQTSWRFHSEAPVPGTDYAAMVFDHAYGAPLMISQPPFARMAHWNGSDWALAYSPQPIPYRHEFAIAYDIARQRVVMFGGVSGSGGGELGDTWEWDGATWQQRATSGPSPRHLTTMVYQASRGRTLLFGGRGSSGYTSDTWEWDGLSWTQLHPAHQPGAAVDPAMAYDIQRDRVVLAVTLGTFADIATWEWNGTDWLQIATNAPGNQPGVKLCYDIARARTLMFGGYYSNELWSWDGATWQRLPTSGPDEPAGRDQPAFEYDAARGRAVLFGGRTLATTILTGMPQDVWEWDGSRWWRRATSPPSRVQHNIAYDTARSTAVLFGGLDAGGVDRADTWEWHNGTWSLNPTAHAPSARRAFALTYDRTRQRCVLFGGHNGTVLDDTWEFDGQDWSQRATALHPSARFDAAMAFDEQYGVAVLFGGDDFQAPKQDTWLWNSTGWAPAQPAHVPAARSAAAMAYDPARQRTLLFGGVGVSVPDTTWEWDGQDWLASAATGPAMRRGAVIAFDPTRQRTVMFGGIDGATLFADTWEWDGTWTQRTTTTPSARAFAAAFYDPEQRRIVLHGGKTIPAQVVIGAVSETWTYGPEQPATAIAFGNACPSSGGANELTATGLPWIGGPFRTDATGLPTSCVVAVVTGFATFDQPLSNVLPVAAPNCEHRVSLDMLDLLVTGDGMTTWNISIPASPTLVGMVAYQQMYPLEVDAQAQILAASSTNSLRLQVGAP